MSVFKKYGCHQIKVDIQLMTVTPADFQNLNVKWAMVNSNAANVQQAGTLPIVESLPVLASGITSVKLPDRPVSAVSYIQKSPVAQYALIEPAEVANMVATVKQADEFRLLSAPSVIVLNGQDASVTQGTMRPFVVGVEYIEVENKSDFVIQPVVQSQLDGIKISMCPILQSQENESVVFELTTILKMSHVLGVEVEELPPVNGKTVKIQIPEIETVEINSSLKIPLNKTLVLSSSFRNKDGVKEKLLACIKCKLVDPSEIVEPPQPTDEPVQMK